MPTKGSKTKRSRATSKHSKSKMGVSRRSDPSQVDEGRTKIARQIQPRFAPKRNSAVREDVDTKRIGQPPVPAAGGPKPKQTKQSKGRKPMKKGARAKSPSAM